MKELDKAYNPAKYEGDIYKMWEDNGFFKPETARDPESEPYAIIMPPPNANGNLHTGHGMYVVDDILARFYRMQGRPVLWLPGTDHAGIETQVVFERELAKEGKSRFDYSPTDFYEAALGFVKQNEGNMLAQMRSMGFSADWSRKQFTLDPKIIEIVYDTFKKMVDDKLVYRGNRIVNWCTHCNSSFADIEIKYRGQADPLYYIKYGPFVLATVRPETKFGDTAIAVNPKDERYRHLIGTEIEAEDLLGPVKFQVIGDDFVSPEFGTGVVKVTPAHDPNDWEMGLRHKLEVKQVIGTDGRLTDLAGKFAGMTVLDARDQVSKELEERGLIDHIDMNYTHSVGYHDRCGTQIEPLVTEQWWLSVEELKKSAIKAIQDGEITFTPARFKKQALDWLEGLRDWNISRQNWFGIRIPVYYNATGDTSLPEFIVATDEAEARSTYGEGGYEAGIDTFDTWFSSGQWPFATLMISGPDDFERFYPTAVMATMRDILYLWVTRMIMFGIYKTGKIPFKDVYLWGALNDAHGKKMSKSKGNVINPLDMTSKFGTDALRLALTIGVTPGTGGSLSESKIEGYRNFCNKLWNVARFILAKVSDDDIEVLRQAQDDKESGQTARKAPVAKSLADHWILDRISAVTESVTADIAAYKFSEAGSAVYSLLWDDFADWYIEASKADTNLDVLVYGLETILALAHPFAPFVTEAIWQNLAWQKQKLIVSAWPTAGDRHVDQAAQFELLKDLVSQVRSIKNELGIGKTLKLILLEADYRDDQAGLICNLAGLSSVVKAKEGRGLGLTVGSLNYWLDLDPVQIDNYIGNIKTQQAEAETYAKRLEAQLSNMKYVESAPAEIVQQTRDRLEDTKMVLSKLNEALARLNH